MPGGASETRAESEYKSSSSTSTKPKAIGVSRSISIPRHGTSAPGRLPGARNHRNGRLVTARRTADRRDVVRYSRSVRQVTRARREGASRRRRQASRGARGTPGPGPVANARRGGTTSGAAARAGGEGRQPLSDQVRSLPMDRCRIWFYFSAFEPPMQVARGLRPGDGQ